MSKISKMTMKEIMDRVNVVLNGVDQIFYFYESEDRKQKIEELRHKMKKDTHSIYEFLVENSENIDKEKFILVITRNHIENLKFIDNKIKEIKRNLNNKLSINDEEKLKLKKSLDDFEKDKKEKEESLKRLRKLGSNLDLIFSIYYYDEESQKYEIDLFDSEIIMTGRRRDSSKQIEKFNKIDEQIKNLDKDKKQGIEFILQTMLLTDFNQIFGDKKFANTVRAEIIDNAILKSKIKTRDQLEEIRNNKLEYDKTAEKLDFDELTGEMKNKIQEYIDYLDFDKLLLVSACKIEDILETGKVDKKYLKGEQTLLKYILDNLKNNNKEYKFDLQFNSNGDNHYIEKELTYSKRNVEECLKRFTENSYLTKKLIEEKRINILEEKLNICDLENGEIDVIFSKEELEKLDSLTDKDIAYLSEKLNWNKEAILDKLSTNKKGCSKDIIEYFIDLQKIDYKDVKNLYFNQTINIDEFKEVCKNVSVSELINKDELIDYYIDSLKENNNEQAKEKYNRYINLCKEYILIDEEKSKQFSEDLMESLVESYDQKNKGAYITKVEEFFGNGLISLDTLLEWNKEDKYIINRIINDMYNQEIIDLEKIKELINSNVLKFEYMEELVNTEQMKKSKILEILEQGFISEESILKLYANERISREDLISLANKDILDSDKVNKVLGVDKEKLTADDQYILLISGALQKIKATGAGKNGSTGLRYNKKVIDPDKRLELFKLLGARKYEAVLPKNSPFYNYDFFVIPGKEKDYKHGTIIAERIYEEKPEHLSENEEAKFATDNATYIFENIEDIKVIERSEKSNKTDAIKKKNGIIKRVNHILSDGRKNGRWAFDLRDAIVKIMIESDLKEYSMANQSTIINQKLREVYGVDTWMKITNKAAEIDCSSDHKMVDEDDEER